MYPAPYMKLLRRLISVSKANFYLCTTQLRANILSRMQDTNLKSRAKPDLEMQTKYSV